jgi:hypothetical protein
MPRLGGGFEIISRLDARYQSKHPDLFVFLKPKKDEDAKKVDKALRGLISKRISLRRQIKKE